VAGIDSCRKARELVGLGVSCSPGGRARLGPSKTATTHGSASGGGAAMMSGLTCGGYAHSVQSGGALRTGVVLLLVGAESSRVHHEFGPLISMRGSTGPAASSMTAVEFRGPRMAAGRRITSYQGQSLFGGERCMRLMRGVAGLLCQERAKLCAGRGAYHAEPSTFVRNWRATSWETH